MSNEEYIQPVGQLSIGTFKPSYTMIFHNKEKTIGTLDFNGPEMVFTGDAEESAKVFFDFIAETFKRRLEEERMAERKERDKYWQAHIEPQIEIEVKEEREACAKVCEDEAMVLFQMSLKCDGDDGVMAAQGNAAEDLAAAIRARSNHA